MSMKKAFHKSVTWLQVAKILKIIEKWWYLSHVFVNIY